MRHEFAGLLRLTTNRELVQPGRGELTCDHARAVVFGKYDHRRPGLQDVGEGRFVEDSLRSEVARNGLRVPASLHAY